MDEQTLASFEKSFDSGEGIIKFIDSEDNDEVKLRNKKPAGYKKSFFDNLLFSINSQYCPVKKV